MTWRGWRIYKGWFGAGEAQGIVNDETLSEEDLGGITIAVEGETFYGITGSGEHTYVVSTEALKTTVVFTGGVYTGGYGVVGLFADNCSLTVTNATVADPYTGVICGGEGNVVSLSDSSIDIDGSEGGASTSGRRAARSS